MTPDIWIDFALALDAIVDHPMFRLGVVAIGSTLAGVVVGLLVGIPIGRDQEAREEWKRLTVLNQQLEAERHRWWRPAR